MRLKTALAAHAFLALLCAATPYAMAAKNPLNTANNTDATASLHLRLNGGKSDFTECSLYFSKADSDTFNAYDAPAAEGVNPAVSLYSYTSDNIATSINSMSALEKGKRVGLFVAARDSRSYTLELGDFSGIDTSKLGVFLIDNLKKDSVNMAVRGSYSFKINAGDAGSFGGGRFVLAIENKPAVTSKAPVITAAKKLFSLYPNPSKDMITVDVSSLKTPEKTYTYNIYDNAGKVMAHRSIGGDKQSENIALYQTGFYVIELKDNNGKLIGRSKFIKTN